MNINGITEIEKFLTCIAEMYLMVVSEKIINDIPEKKVTNFNLVYFKLSFDDNVNKSDTRTNNGM
tara:strand:+ start:292 stop:486 length:195 start_codon:yes stop_codon:yes gene_type:complete